MALLDSLQTASAVSIAACLLIYALYRWALPRPIAGIPYNSRAVRSPFGDIPSMLADMAKTGKSPLVWMLEQLEQLDAPLVQVFIHPFSRPRLLLADFREGQDILMRRKDFDRSEIMGDLFSGLVPEHHIHRPTNATWKSNRRILQDLMSPKFLHDVAGPVIHRNASNLVRLWQRKSSIAGNRPFNASEDIYYAALDAVLAFSFGEQFSHSAVMPNVDLLGSLSEETVSNLQESASVDEPVTFPEAKQDDAIAATLDLATAVEELQGSAMPRWKWWFMENFTAVGQKVQIKSGYIDDELRKAVARKDEQAGSEVSSAVDLMIRRETILAKKDGRAPNYLSRTMRDEAFGFVVAGHDTTSTTVLWALKYLADTSRVQAHLREAMQLAFATAKAEKRNPSISEITSTTVPYLDASMEEILRCSGTVPAVDRMAVTDTELLGHPIPKGTVVVILGQGPSMRSRAFDIDEKRRSKSCQDVKTQGKHKTWDADDIAEFKPERWLIPSSEKQESSEFDAMAGPQLAFGLGSRGCFGKRLAYIELRILLSLIVWNFHLIRCPDELSSYAQKAGITHKPYQCYVRLQPVEL
ncbi:cytochrome P450 [Hypoxylon sp. FL0890]|nr:cytochrome P450 [Hypoxylon sp. FL0890]